MRLRLWLDLFHKLCQFHPLIVTHTKPVKYLETFTPCRLSTPCTLVYFQIINIKMYSKWHKIRNINYFILLFMLYFSGNDPDPSVTGPSLCAYSRHDTIFISLCQSLCFSHWLTFSHTYSTLNKTLIKNAIRTRELANQ